MQKLLLQKDGDVTKALQAVEELRQKNQELQEQIRREKTAKATAET